PPPGCRIKALFDNARGPHLFDQLAAGGRQGDIDCSPTTSVPAFHQASAFEASEGAGNDNTVAVGPLLAPPRHDRFGKDALAIRGRAVEPGGALGHVKELVVSPEKNPLLKVGQAPAHSVASDLSANNRPLPVGC